MLPLPHPLKAATLSLLGLLAMERGWAATTLFDVPAQTTFFETHGNGMVGYTFWILNPVIVTSIGWYDYGGDGLSRDYQVGLWKGTNGSFGLGEPVQDMLTPATGTGIIIPASATLQGLWRVTELASPLTLQPGYYQLGGLDTSSTTDPIRYILQNASEYSNENATLGQFFYPGMQPIPSGFGPVNFLYLANGFELGPMLFIVPEPSTACLATVGIALWSARRRRLASAT